MLAFCVFLFCERVGRELLIFVSRFGLLCFSFGSFCFSSPDRLVRDLDHSFFSGSDHFFFSDLNHFVSERLTSCNIGSLFKMDLLALFDVILTCHDACDDARVRRPGSSSASEGVHALLAFVRM